MVGLRLMSAAARRVPTIDLAAPKATVAAQVSAACSSWGFFQIVNHGVDAALVSRFDEQMRHFFALPLDTKRRLKRSGSNARGFFDDELTKQRRDWKEALDFGTPGSRDWDLDDADPRNANLDGLNRFPDPASLPNFRPTMLEYFRSLEKLSEDVSVVMARGLNVDERFFADQLSARHMSYLRLNYYPPAGADAAAMDPPPLGISPHRDAGFLTVLKQDEECHSLQMRCPATGGEWLSVAPEPGAFTINTGDLAQIWSNDRYHAPEHRVLTNSTKPRCSAPFFYNPGFDTRVAPLPELGEPRYSPLLWGYYRAQRFAGDFADWGEEIQISHFALPSGSWHVTNQQRFIEETDLSKPFSVEAHRGLLTPPQQ